MKKNPLNYLKFQFISRFMNRKLFDLLVIKNLTMKF